MEIRFSATGDKNSWVLQAGRQAAGRGANKLEQSRNIQATSTNAFLCVNISKQIIQLYAFSLALTTFSEEEEGRSYA